MEESPNKTTIQPTLISIKDKIEQEITVTVQSVQNDQNVASNIQTNDNSALESSTDYDPLEKNITLDGRKFSGNFNDSKDEGNSYKSFDNLENIGQISSKDEMSSDCKHQSNHVLMSHDEGTKSHDLNGGQVMKNIEIDAEKGKADLGKDYFKDKDTKDDDADEKEEENQTTIIFFRWIEIFKNTLYEYR